MTSTEAMTVRERTAGQQTVASLMELGDLTEAQAVHVFNLYLKHKLFNTRHVYHGGVYEVKHGAYLNKDVLQRAAALTDL